MRTHRAKSGYLPAEYIPLAFLTRTPSPYSAGWRWGLLSRKIFYFFLNPLSTRSNYTSIFIFFLIFARIHRMFGLRIFWILYSLFLIIKFLEYFSRVNINSYLFRLVSALFILRFDSSTLYLFNFSACYEQTFMLMWVCFMLILAILRLSDVFSFVLGVVYRLGLK